MTEPKTKSRKAASAEPSAVATARYGARKGRGLVTVHATLTKAEAEALDRVRMAMGLPEFGGRHVRGGRAEAIRQLILAADSKKVGAKNG